MSKMNFCGKLQPCRFSCVAEMTLCFLALDPEIGHVCRVVGKVISRDKCSTCHYILLVGKLRSSKCRYLQLLNNICHLLQHCVVTPWLS